MASFPVAGILLAKSSLGSQAQPPPRLNRQECSLVVIAVFSAATCARGARSICRVAGQQTCRSWRSRRSGAIKSTRRCATETTPLELGGHFVSPHYDNPHTKTLIYLHGFTCDGDQYLQHDSELSVPWRLGNYYAPGLRTVLPDAPYLQQPWDESTMSWYVYASSESNDVGDTVALEAVRAALDDVIHSEIEQLEGDANCLFLGGCSQGCTMALDTYLRHATRLNLGGFVGSTGFWPRDEYGFCGADAATEKLARAELQSQRPIWLQCAPEDDEAVPWTLVESSLQGLQSKLPGLVVNKLDGFDHAIGEYEATILNDFLWEHGNDAYYEDEHNYSDEEYWDFMDVDIDIDVGPEIPGMYA